MTVNTDEMTIEELTKFIQELEGLKRTKQRELHLEKVSNLRETYGCKVKFRAGLHSHIDRWFVDSDKWRVAATGDRGTSPTIEWLETMMNSEAT